MQGEIDRYILQFNDMRDSYDSWNKNIKKPFDLKEAALFALEARILNEEHARINEAITVKDVINKLIYSVQQHLSSNSQYLQGKDIEEVQRGERFGSAERTTSNSLERDQGKVAIGNVDG